MPKIILPNKRNSVFPLPKNPAEVKFSIISSFDLYTGVTNINNKIKKKLFNTRDVIKGFKLIFLSRILETLFLLMLQMESNLLNIMYK